MPEDPTGIGRGAEAFEKVTREVRELAFNLLSPAAAEAGEYFADKVRIYRFKAAIHAIQKANALIEKSGLKIKGIDLKRLVPMLEGASLEEDEGLVTKWAGLMASAATGSDVLPSFADILRHLTPEEVRMLNFIFDHVDDTPVDIRPVQGIAIQRLQEMLNIQEEQFMVRVQNLHRLELIIPRDSLWDLADVQKQRGFPQYYDWASVDLTDLGKAFVKACRGPSAKS